jgi:hypothetical protein
MASTWRRTNSNGHVVDGLNVVFRLDDDVKTVTGLDGLWDSYANNSSTCKCEKRCNGSEGGLESHVDDIWQMFVEIHCNDLQPIVPESAVNRKIEGFFERKKQALVTLHYYENPLLPSL